MAWSKESSHLRGYGAAWRKIRLRILERDHWLCQCKECAKRPVPLPANEVNHKTPKAEAQRRKWTQEQIDAESNLESVNSVCHERITKEQKGYRIRPKIGLDGWPE